jgi:hypothetical protein
LVFIIFFEFVFTIDVPFAVKFDSPRQGLVQMEVTACGRVGVWAGSVGFFVCGPVFF